MERWAFMTRRDLRQLRNRAAVRTDDPLWRVERELLEQVVGDRQKRGAADHKQDAVEQRQPPADRRARKERSQERLARHWVDHDSTDDFAGQVTAT